MVLSTLDEAKHLDRLIQAFAQVQGQVKENWQLVIYGDGPARESLEALVADLHLSDRVSLPGSCYDLTKAFSGASLSALVSGNEGQGLNVVEAAMAGMPSVVTPCSPGAIELAEHGGYLAGGLKWPTLRRLYVKLCATTSVRRWGCGRRPMRSVLALRR